MNATATLPYYPDLKVIGDSVVAGDYETALTLVNEALEHQPANHEFWYLKGTLHRKMKDRPNALLAFNRAIQQHPSYLEACRDLALTLEESDQPLLAIKAYEHLLRIFQANAQEKPRPPMTNTSEKALREWFDKGLAQHKKGHYAEAVTYFRKALAIYPDMPEGLANLGMMLYHLRLYDEAEEIIMKCLRLRPGYSEALNVLGNVYRETNRRLFAIAAYRQALATKPLFRHASINIGKVFFEMQNYVESIKAYEHTLTLDPMYVETLTEITHMSHLICQWDKVATYQAHTRKALLHSPQCAEPFIYAVHGDVDLQQSNAKRWTQRHFPAGKPYNVNRPLPADARKNGTLRLGYLSCDYHRHATVTLMGELFAQHDRKHFEVYAYSYGVDDKGPERARIMSNVDKFCDIRAFDERTALETILKDELDILVDLKGYTQNHRLGLLSARPAPLQIHYLGHPGTLGANFVDYFITDTVATPPEFEGEFAEQLIRLPYSYQINDRSRPLPTSGPPREAYGLPEKGFVFCDFNNPYKITPVIFAVWMRLLHKVPGSVLWLYENRTEATENLLAEAQKHNINRERLIFAKPVLLAEHLARYRHVDLFLDTAPVCGHTTTSDALWCAVPPVTLAGNSFVSRVAMSLLHAVGLPELIAPNLEAYETLALELVHNPERLQNLKRHLEAGRMTFPLFDSIHTTRALEAAYKHAAQLHHNKISPRGFNVLPNLAIV